MEKLRPCPRCHKAMTLLNFAGRSSPAWKGEPAWESHMCHNCKYEVKGYGATYYERVADATRRWNKGQIVNDQTLFEEVTNA